jgi:tRNA A-37 threonylcarbamoyl transferase component Bud32
MISIEQSARSFENDWDCSISVMGELKAVLVKASGPLHSKAPAISLSTNIQGFEPKDQVIGVKRRGRWLVALTMRSKAEYHVNIQNSRMVSLPGLVVFFKGPSFLAIPQIAFKDQKEILLLQKYTIKVSDVWATYKVIEYLDETKAIVLAYNRVTGEKVVAKRIQKRGKKQWLEAILTELCSFQVLSGCLNAAQFLEVYESAKEVTIIMEFFSKTTLTDLVSQRQLKEYQAHDIMIQLLEFLADANRSGFSHRDLKPDNILVRENKSEMSYTVRVIDFGFAQNMKVSLSQRVNMFCGTPGFAAPEIFRGKDYGMNVDVFSLGCVFYFLLTRKLIFSDERLKRSTKEANMECDLYRQLRDLQGCCSPSSLELLVRMLEKDPRLRLSALEALDHFLNQDKNFSFISIDSVDLFASLEEEACY